MRKKLLTVLLSCAVAVTAVSMPAFAETPASSDPQTAPVSTEQAQIPDGLTEENGSICYYENGQKVTGWKTVDGNTYYFQMDGSAAADGWKTIANSSGKNRVYYFDKQGVRKTGILKVDGKLYYTNKSGVLRTKKGWFTGTDGNRRYCLGSSGALASGVKKIGKKLYYFSPSKGTLHRSAGWFKNGKDTYYCLGKGVLAVKWKALKRKGKLGAYYFSPKTGKMARNTTVKHLKVPKSGRLGTAYAEGIQVLDKIGWNLKTAFFWDVNTTRYRYHDMRRKNIESYARFGFRNHCGNCYVFASQFYVMAKLLGYDAHQMYGDVGHVPNPHSWVVIPDKKGTQWVYDLTFQQTGRRIINGKRVGTGFHFRYRTPNTWKYINIKEMH